MRCRGQRPTSRIRLVTLASTEAKSLAVRSHRFRMTETETGGYVMTKQPHVLVPVDGSAAAKRAVGYGTLLADRLSARISFPHVRPPIGSSGEPKVGSDDEAEALLEAIAVCYP